MNRVVSVLMLLSGAAVLSACKGEATSDNSGQQAAAPEAPVVFRTGQLIGTWEMTSLYHSMMEKEFEGRLKYLDTMTVLELGQIAMWNTDDVETVRENERKMIREDRENYKKPFLGSTYTFLNDSVLVRKIVNTTDTNIYSVEEGKIRLRPVSGPGKEHTLYVREFGEHRMKIKEDFPGGNEILTEFKKQ